MEVQKYIKRLKFARADMERTDGYFKDFRDIDEAKAFLDKREFFFGDPFVVKYGSDGDKRLALAIGKGPEPSKEDKESGTVSGESGAYELFDLGEVWREIEELKESVSANTEAIDEINDAIDEINDLINEISGSTGSLLEITGEGWTDSPDNVTLTNRIKRDERLAGIVWGHNDDEPYDGHLPDTNLPYASGNSLAEMVGTISDTLDGVLFKDGDEIKTVGFDYNSERNILYYTAGTQTGEIELSQASVVDRAYYDPETEELVIVFVLGEGRRQEVRIPVGELISEWEPVDSDTVHLERERAAGDGKDRLSAYVKVSDDQDNMLVAKGDGLYVSSEKIDETNERIDSIEDELPKLKTVVKVDENAEHLTLDERIGEDGNIVYTIGENDIASKSELESAVDAIEGEIDGVKGKIDEISGDSQSIEERVETLESQVSEHSENIANLGDGIASVSDGLQDTNAILDNIKVLLNTEEDGHFTERFLGPHTSSVDTYYDAVNALDGALVDAEDASRDMGNSFVLSYDDQAQKITLTWQVDGSEKSSDVDVSDFVKDSFLEGVQVVNHDGVQCLEFRFKTYDGKPLPIYVPLTELATIYGAGDGIDGTELEDNQIITVKIDEFGSIPNFLAKSANGLRVTGVTEAIQDAIEHADFSAYVEKSEVEAHLDSASTLPVQNRVVTEAIAALEREITGQTTDALTGVVMTGSGNVVTAVTKNGFDVEAKLGELDLDDYAKKEELEDYVKKDEVEEHLDSASTLPVQNKVVAEEIEGLKDSMSDLEDGIDALSEIAITELNVTGSGNVVTNIDRNGNAIDVEFGNIDLSTVLSLEEFNSYTASTSTAFTSENMTTTALTANTVYADEYGNLPTATTEQYGVVILDDELDIDSANPVENSAVTFAINELESGLSQESEARTDADDELRSMITAETESRQESDGELGDAIAEEAGSREEGDAELHDMVTAETLNRQEADDELRDMITAETKTREDSYDELHDMVTAETSNRESEDDELRDAITAETEERKEADEEIWDAIETLSGGGITGVTTTGSGNVVVEIFKENNSVVGRLGNVNVSDKLDVTVFESFTGATLNDVQESGSGPFVSSVSKSGDKVAVTKSNSLSGLDGLSASTVYAGDYENLPTATTGNYGMVKVDSTIDSASTNPVQNSAIYNSLKTLSEGSLTGVTSSGSGVLVTNVEKDGQNVKFTKSNSLNGISGITANTLNATTYENLPTATTIDYGMVKVDESLSLESNNPVANSAVTKTITDNELVIAASLNQLNDEKADVEMLERYLPLSGGMMSGDISGETGVAVYMPGGFFQESDERLKIFIGDVEGALEKVGNIPAKYFYWKNLVDGPRQLGTSAQKVKEVFPEIVSGEERLSVDYSKLAVVAIAAIKELSAKVDYLQRQLDEFRK